MLQWNVQGELAARGVYSATATREAVVRRGKKYSLLTSPISFLSSAALHYN